MSDAELMRWEKRARMEGTMESFVGPNRRILQKTGLLKKSVTVPGAKSNIWRTEGTKLIWGTDLVYAGVHNRGFPAKNIPKRTFLVVRDEWMKQLNEYILAEVVKIIRQKIFRGGS
jgi:phage gpG-like protein